MGQLQEVSQDKIEHYVRVLWHVILKMIGASEYAVEIDKLQAEIKEKQHKVLQFQLARMQMVMKFWDADYESFLDLAQRSDFDKDAYAKNNPCVYGIIPLAFNMAFSAVVAAQNAVGRNKKRYRKIYKKFSSKIFKWSDIPNPNVIHLKHLLEAEASILSKRPYRAVPSFEDAIFMAEARGFTNYLALAHERFSYYLEQNSQSSRARDHLNKAINLYVEWGAVSRARSLETTYRRLYKNDEKSNDKMTFVHVFDSAEEAVQIDDNL